MGQSANSLTDVMIKKGFGSVALSNARTMQITSKKDKRQKLPTRDYIVPNKDIRRLRALLILEEAVETVRALGFEPVQKTVQENGLLPTEPHLVFDLKPLSGKVNLEKIIDGCCDVIYVAEGLLVSCGVPSKYHLYEVCRANEDKFPGGVAVISGEGKYLKPAGWEPPDHKSIINRSLVQQGRKKK